MMQAVNWLLIALIGLCSGCSAALPPAPLILNLPDCPAPASPVLPLMDGGQPFDAPDNVSVLMRRDDILRFYIKGLQAAIICYQKQGDVHERH